MPHRMHPNSLENLKKGKATQFGANGDSTAIEAGKKSGESRNAIRSIADEMRDLLTPERRKALSGKLILNMEKSPEWYKLGLRMIGELPPEQLQVDSVDMSALERAFSDPGGDMI